MPRLFTALPVPEQVRDHLQAVRGERPADIDLRWTSPDQYHVTVRFVGDVSEEQARRYQDALHSLDARPVRLVPYGFDVLPSRRRPRVLIVGFELTDPLRALYRSAGDVLETAGLDPEERRYKPHVTLARLRNANARAVHQYLRTWPPLSLDAFTVESLVLYTSTLTPDGPVYEQRASYALRSDS